ncbi:hypothetical protein [Prosthecobacter sp.]|jgi:hypothetical protein|uniref:hypothetical protein n=1 Tax=Prosthecobacter sp. TaxID=1965333 RepID=UPI0037851EF0
MNSSFAKTAFAVLALALATLVHATVDESHDFAMEAAMPFVEQGFIVREDYWNGEVKSGQKLMITHQLFKGNEYAFWLGTANEGVALDMKVFDEKGQPVQINAKADKFFMSVRVNPPKTGTYRIVFELKSKKEPSVMWALAYGYR